MFITIYPYKSNTISIRKTDFKTCDYFFFKKCKDHGIVCSEFDDLLENMPAFKGLQYPMIEVIRIYVLETFLVQCC